MQRIIYTPASSGKASANNTVRTLEELAVRRLLWDMKELQNYPLPFCCASPDEGNIREWHANFLPLDGPYQGIPIHVHLLFPDSYPNTPPRVSLITKGLSHPNVFETPGADTWICLDMLRDNRASQTTPYQGWSSAYTVSAILTQLYGFLLVDSEIAQDYGDTYSQATFSGASNLSADATTEELRRCICGFHKLPGDDQATQNGDSTALSDAVEADHSASASCDKLKLLGVDLLRAVTEHLDHSDLHKLQATVGPDHEANGVAEQRLSAINLFCFHSRMKHDEAETILGYGLTVHRFVCRKRPLESRGVYGDRNNPRNSDDRGPVKLISLAGYDYLSLASFDGPGAVRKSAWNLPFNAFLPLYLNPTHGRRALCVLHDQTDRILGAAHRDMEAHEKLLFCFGKLMNSLVVDLFSTKEQDKRHMCDAAIQAFFHMHHLLIAVSLSPGCGGQDILRTAERDITAFVDDQRQRHKSVCPDLGVLLLKLLLVPSDTMPWSRFAPVFTRELLSRQVRWVDTANVPPSEIQFVYLRPDIDHPDLHDFLRIKHHFDHSTASLRIVAMETWFANVVARPAKASTAIHELESIKRRLDMSNGQPPLPVRDAFWDTFKLFEAGKSFSAFFDRMGICPRPRPTHSDALARMLRQAVLDSRLAGYHNGPSFSKSLSFVDWSNDPLEVFTTSLPQPKLAS